MTPQALFHVAEYIRLSREDGDKAESDSIGNQRKLIADYLKGREGFIVFDTYVDDGFSGTTFNRPAFRRMMGDIESGNVNCVIVKDLSRFGRDYINAGNYLERYFPEQGVRFISITDNIDSFEQAYDMLLPIKNIFNEQYARDISRKIHASIETKQKAGEFIGAFASYGYKKSPADKNKLIIDPYAAEVVRRIFDLYIRGYGKIRIAGRLNEEGIVCPSEYKKLNGENYRNSTRLENTSYWTYSTINRILQNEIYTGNMVQGRKSQKMRSKAKARNQKDWIVVPKTHEAIIDPATWEKAQNLLKRRTRNLDLNTNVNVFAGFLKCGDCGRALVKKTYPPVSDSGYSNKKSAASIHYFCGTYVRSGRQYCTPHRISYKALETVLLEDLRTVLQSMNNLKEITALVQGKGATARPDSGNADEMDTADKREKEKAQIELNRVRKLKKAIYEDYREELISKEEFVAYRQDYIQKEELLNRQLAALEERAKAQITGSIWETSWIKRLLELGKIEDLDRDTLSVMLHEIKVYENHTVNITYNFSGELKHLFANDLSL